jgi:hypothetical protein
VAVDRVSAFNNPEVIRMLQSEFIPVAVDGGLMRRRQDPEGDFYRKFANTQARYAAAADGTSLAEKTWVPSPHLNKWMKEALTKFETLPKSSRSPSVDPAEAGKRTSPVSRAIQKLISSAKPAIDQLRCSVLSGISSEPRVLTEVSANIGVRILLANNLRLLSARICLVRSV